MSSIFNKEAISVTPNQQSSGQGQDLNLVNFGIPIKVATIKVDKEEGSLTNGMVLIAGTVMSDMDLAKEGDAMTVAMSATQYKNFIGHGMQRNMAAIERGENRYEGSELVLGGCYKNKDGIVFAKNGVVATHVERGEVEDRPLSIAPSHWIGGLDVVLFSLDDLAKPQNERSSFVTHIQEYAIGDGGIKGAIREDGKYTNISVEQGEAGKTFTDLGNHQQDSLKITNGFAKTLTISMKVFRPDLAILVSVENGAPEAVQSLVKKVQEGEAPNSLVIRAKNGDMSHFYLREGSEKADVDANAKAIEKLTDFAALHEKFEAIPQRTLYMSNPEAAKVAVAYGNYISSLGTNLDYKAKWKMFQKELSTYLPQFGRENNEGRKFNQLHLLLSTMTRQNAAGENYDLVSVTSAVPAINQSFSELPSIHFTVEELKKKGPVNESATPAAEAQKPKEAKANSPSMG